MTKPLALTATRVPINWHAGLSIYAAEPFLKVVGDEYGWLGGADESGKLRCILPYTIVRKAILRMVRFRVETIPLEEGLTMEEEKTFLNSAIEYFRGLGADLIIPATTNTIFRTYPDGAVAAPYGTYIIDLNQPEETLWNNLHSKHRNVIRNAMKKGVEIRRGINYLDAAYELVRTTLKRSHLGFTSYASLKQMINNLPEGVEVFMAEHQGTVQGCAIIPFSGYSAYYLYGGSAANPVSGATNLLQWEAMRYFKKLGVKHYDFVGVRINPEKGSKQEGLQMFKERFGGRLVQGYMWKYPLKPIKYFLYGLAARLRRGGDIVDYERKKLQQWQNREMEGSPGDAIMQA